MTGSSAAADPGGTSGRTVRAAVGLPHFGAAVGEHGIAPMAQSVEEHGFDIWLSDHVVLIEEPESRYPFSADGRFFLEPTEDWYDYLTVASYLAACTDRAELTVAVAVGALRHPLEQAKQIATLDRLSGSRIRIGLGAGWLVEELAALGVPTGGRGARLDATIDVMRAAWTGAPAPGEYGPFSLPEGVRVHPTPARVPPLLIGGDSPRALERVARRADGWIGMAPGGHIAPDHVREVRRVVAEHCASSGRDPREIVTAVRLGAPARAVHSGALAEQLTELAEAGVEEFGFDLAWRDLAETRELLWGVREAIDRVSQTGCGAGEGAGAGC